MPIDPTLERTFRGHRSAINSAAFLPNMKQMVSGGDDDSIMLWNFKANLRAYRFREHEGSVNSVAVAPQGNLIASASSDRTVRLWSTNLANTRSSVIKSHTGTVRDVQVSATCQFHRSSHDANPFAVQQRQRISPHCVRR
jgi:centriolar protein POC1